MIDFIIRLLGYTPMGIVGISIPTFPKGCFKRSGKVLFEELDHTSLYISKSNEPDKYHVVKFIRMEVYPNFSLPLFRDIDTGEEFVCMGGIFKYSERLLNELDKLRPIEQWNYLVCNHAQIDNKYGIDYKTFSCECDPLNW